MPSFDYFVSNGAGSFQDGVGSGLGWFGPAGFGSSVTVGSFQDKTYIADGAGTVQGPEAWNVRYLSTGSGLIGQTGSGLPLTSIPNYQASLNIRFSHGSAVRTTNVRFKCYDREDPNRAPSGVVVYGAEVVHPATAQNNTGSGSTTWTQLSGSGSYLDLTASPGTSGFRPLGASTSDQRHDWYLIISAQPSQIGSQTNIGFLTELEYL